MQIARRPLSIEQPLLDHFHPVLARVFAARDIRHPDELDYGLGRLHSFATLSGIDAAVRLLHAALGSQQRVMLVADFDADGATSCAVAVRGLRLMGARHVSYIVPNRFEFGYGLTPELVEVARRDTPELLITVDNGVSSVAGVQAAKQHGIKVLITDHHLPGHELPAADAIVNPNLPGDAFPSKHLAGVGVIFYVLLALRARLREVGWFRKEAVPEPNLAQLLDLVALGTVADLVPLDHNNRILVAQGLRRIRRGRCQPGVSALLQACGRERSTAVAADLAFGVAPRLNAAGRLSDMSIGIECLTGDNREAVLAIAMQLDALNRERQAIEGDMHTQALRQVEDIVTRRSGPLPYGLCLFDETWHQGVIGILASRVKEQVQRPVIAFAPAGEDELKGSARSVPRLHMRDTLEAIAVRQPGLIEKFGGHAMAAGLALKRPQFDAFTQAFDEEVRRRLCSEDLADVVHSDGALPEGDLSLEFASLLREAGPWGQAFPEPVFDGAFRVRAQRRLKGGHLKLELEVSKSGTCIDAIAFSRRDRQWVLPSEWVYIAYRLEANRYRGVVRPCLLVEHLEPCSPVGP